MEKVKLDFKKVNYFLTWSEIYRFKARFRAYPEEKILIY